MINSFSMEKGIRCPNPLLKLARFCFVGSLNSLEIREQNDPMWCQQYTRHVYINVFKFTTRYIISKIPNTILFLMEVYERIDQNIIGVELTLNFRNKSVVFHNSVPLSNLMFPCHTMYETLAVCKWFLMLLCLESSIQLERKQNFYF